MKRRRKVLFGVYLEADALDDLHEIRTETRVPTAVFVRQAIDEAITRWKRERGKGSSR